MARRRGRRSDARVTLMASLVTVTTHQPPEVKNPCHVRGTGPGGQGLVVAVGVREIWPFVHLDTSTFLESTFISSTAGLFSCSTHFFHHHQP